MLRPLNDLHSLSRPKADSSFESMRGPRLPTGVIVFAVVLRIGSAFLQGDAVAPLPGIHDQLSYHALAQRLVQVHELSFGENWWPMTRAGEPTAHWSFPYTGFLAVSYALFGVHPIVPRLFQAILSGLLQPWLTWKIALSCSSRRVALMAAWLAAAYLYFVYYAGALMTESFFIVAVLWSLWQAVRLGIRAASEAPGASDWAGLGLAVGVACLMRQSFLLFVPFLLYWVLRRTYMKRADRPREGWWGRFRTRGWAGPAVFGVILLLLICPFTVRNYLVFHRFVLLNTNAGFAFFWGNHPVHGSTFVSILPSDGPGYQDLIPEELADLDEAALDQALLWRGFGFVQDDPIRFVLLSVSRVPALFRFWPSIESSLLSNLVRTLSFGLLLPFSVYGILRAFLSRGRQKRRGVRFGTLDLLFLFVSVYSAIHLVSWALVRYRLPVDAALVIFAAVGVESLGVKLGVLAKRTCGLSAVEDG